MRLAQWLMTAGAVVLVAGLTPAGAQTEMRDIVDHIHLSVPDQAEAVEWYRKHFGGEPMTEGPDRLIFGETRLLFRPDEAAQPSSGSVLDHIGFSVSDLDATVSALETDGATVATPARDVEGLFRLGLPGRPMGRAP